MNTDVPAQIIAKFQVKYDWLKSKQGGVPTLEGAIEPGIYKTPDGGWQCNYDGAWGYGCAITIRPGEAEPHEVHGEICKRWYQEGGAFDWNRQRGWLGYPVSDEEVYEDDGNPADRISHFENGDIIWSENTKEARTVKKNNKEMTALNPKRREIIKPLEGLRGLVKRPGNGLTDSRVMDMERGIDKLKRSICYDRYRVTVFGAFSAGKSTLLNALMGADYLPSADLPTTNITTEIFRSEQFYVFMPNCDFKGAQLKALQDEVSKEIPGGTFLENLERDGQTISGIGVGFQPSDSKGFRQVIEQLADEQSCHETGLSRFKKRIKDGSSTVLQLGIPNLPEWLGEITLTDAPGAGSVYKGHESIIDDIIPKTQLVLYVVESPKAGSSVDEWLCNRIVNSYRRKVFFILNKIDQQNNDEINDALAELKEHIPSVKAGDDGEPTPPKPEFLKTSALCESFANRLSDSSATIDDLIDSKKLSISKLLVSDEWAKARNEDERKNAAIRFLREQSQFDKLRKRIKSYLHEENKELPFCERAESLIMAVGTEMGNIAATTAQALREDKSAEILTHQQRKFHAQRERHAKEARGVLEDFREAALNSNSGIMAKARSELESIPNNIADTLAKKLEDKDEFKRLTSKKGTELQAWLSRKVSGSFDSIVKTTMRELRRQSEHLTERLRPILKKIDEASLMKPDIGNEFDGKASAAYKTVTAIDTDLATGVAAGASALVGGALAAVLGLTIGTVAVPVAITLPTAVAGTGLAGAASAIGLSGVASTLAGWGAGTLPTTVMATKTVMTTAAFWGLGLGPAIAIVAVAAAALAVVGFFIGGGILREKATKKIVAKVREELEKQIVGDDDSSAVNKLKAKVEEVVNVSVDGCRKNLDHYLESLDRQEKAMIDEIGKAVDEKTQKVDSLEKFGEEIKTFVESSRQMLHELNPGKEPAHG